MAEKTKIEIEIEPKTLEQIRILSEYMNCTVNSLIDRILTKELKYYTYDNFRNLHEFANDMLFFNNLIKDLKGTGAKNK